MAKRSGLLRVVTGGAVALALFGSSLFGSPAQADELTSGVNREPASCANIDTVYCVGSGWLFMKMCTVLGGTIANPGQNPSGTHLCTRDW